MTDDDWIDQWLQVRRALGIETFNPPCPAPASDGSATCRPLETDEISDWLRLTLKGRDDLTTGSRSLKATLLSYCSKRGMPREREERLALGTHAHNARVAEVYGRDALARPLRLLLGLLKEIRSGAFLPDLSRSGRLVTIKELDAKGLPEEPWRDPRRSSQMSDASVYEPSLPAEVGPEDGGEVPDHASSGNEASADSSSSGSESEGKDLHKTGPKLSGLQFLALAHLSFST